MSPQRRLAAILAADVARYAALMSVDEDGTVAALRELRRIVDPILGGHGGRIANTAGDSIIAEFASVSAAVDAAVEIQRSAEAGATGLALRIGINLGDVIVAEDGDVFGDGVNVAARLEAIADPGGILVTASVRDSLRGRSPISFEDLGAQNVKHIDEPIRIFRAELGLSGPPVARPQSSDDAGPDLLERTTEMGQLGEALAEAIAGRGRLALITGEAGIGKSSLVRSFAATAPSDVEVLWGWCDDLVTPRALGPFYDMAAGLGTGFSAALADDSKPELVLRALHDALMQKPRIVVIEDLHWADDATLDALTFLARRIGAMPVLMVATVRDEGAHRARSAIANAPPSSVVRIHPAALSASAIATLTGDAADAERLRRLTGGNPFFVTEVLGAESSVPESVQDAVLARIDRLSPPAQKAARLVSVSPSRIEFAVVEALVDGADPAVGEAERAHLLTRSKGGVSFRHELARRAVLATLPESEARDCHGAVLHQLEAMGADPARLVHHAEGAGDEEAVSRHALRAAKAAVAVGAHREATAHFERALNHEELLSDADLEEALRSFSYESMLLERSGPALEAATRLHKLHQEAGNHLMEGDDLRWLSRLAWIRGEGGEAARQGDAAIEVLESLGDTVELAHAYSNRSQLAMLSQHDDDAIAWGERAIALAEKLGDDQIRAHALVNVGTALYRRDAPRGESMLLEAYDLANRAGIPHEALRAIGNLSWEHIIYRQWDLARSRLGQALAESVAEEIESFITYFTGAFAWLYLETGEWDKAEEKAKAAIGRTAPSTVARVTIFHALALLAARRGSLTEGRRLAEETWTLARAAGEIQRIGPAAAALAEAAWLEDDLATVVPRIETAHTLALEVDEWRWAGNLGRWLRIAGEPVQPARHSEPNRAEIQGDFETAARQWKELRCPYDEALCLAWAGHLDQAAAILEPLGAIGTLRRIGR